MRAATLTPRHVAVIGFALILVLACACAPDDAAQDYETSEEPALTYYRDIKPILDARCVGCHVEGGIAPFALTSYEQAASWRDVVRDAVEQRVMPPWLAADGCTEYLADQSLTQEQIDAIAAWAELDGPEGDPADEGPPLPEEPSYALSRVDHNLIMTSAYTPQATPDDYRCFVIDWPEDHTTFLTGLRVNPGDKRVVHHGIVFVAAAEHAGSIAALEAEDAELGYPCFGGPEVPAAWLGVWLPGTAGADFPQDTGIRIEPGAKIILQIHYSTAAGQLPDRTSVDVKVDDDVLREAWIQPWTNFEWYAPEGLTIPAGDADFGVSMALDPTLFVTSGEPLVMHTVGLHMHLLGRSGRVALERADGSEDCLLEIPRWDFHWQGAYGLAEPRVVEPGDRIRQECRWDNSAENQPIGPGGERLPPVDVYWGEGTHDEMCLGAFYVSTL